MKAPPANSESIGFRPVTRPLYVIAKEIWNDWPRPYFGAKPYLVAMASLAKITDDYYLDSGKSVVWYFLANAATWRGPVAQRLKNELRGMLAGSEGESFPLT